MKRGLKVAQDINTRELMRAVEESSPMKRGLKAPNRPRLSATRCHVEESSPMKRGLKVHRILRGLGLPQALKSLPR